MSSYFSSQYSRINDINLNDKEGISNWYLKNLESYSYEFSNLKIDFENKIILEIGCGIGGFLYYLNHKGISNFLGIDIDEKQISVCKQFVTPKVICKDVFEFLDETNEKFDVIVMFDVIEHIKKDNIIPLLKEINNILNKNGLLVLRTPNMASMTSFYSRYLDFTHEIGFTSESLEYVLNETNFKNISFSNSAIGRKRIFVTKLITKFIFNLLRFPAPKIFTSNILAVAKKIK
ncbi:MAG: class I SAM-dependent methyltransferase [Melioribacteraceae bacterium]|nr:class I SAM-dependent methyltransferase [Melioribacteraceae bacterium]